MKTNKKPLRNPEGHHSAPQANRDLIDRRRRSRFGVSPTTRRCDVSSQAFFSCQRVSTGTRNSPNPCRRNKNRKINNTRHQTSCTSAPCPSSARRLSSAFPPFLGSDPAALCFTYVRVSSRFQVQQPPTTMVGRNAYPLKFREFLERINVASALSNAHIHTMFSLGYRYHRLYPLTFQTQINVNPPFAARRCESSTGRRSHRYFGPRPPVVRWY